MDKFELPDQHLVTVYELGRWRWSEIRWKLKKLQEVGHSILWIESSGVFKRVFVVMGTARSIDLLNKYMSTRITEVKTTAPKVVLFAVCLAIPAMTVLAGDHEGGYGMMADHGQNGRSDTQTSYSLRQDGGWFTDAYGRSIFSWDYLTSEGSGTGTFTDYDGGPGDETGCCEAGIGSWGSGGGTGAGARGY